MNGTRCNGDSQRGVTMLELLVAVVILGILAAIAAPYMGNYIERQRWVGAAEAVYGQLQHAKRSAMANNTTIYFNAADAASTNWCTGYGDAGTCDCKTASSCQVNGQDTLTARATDYPGIQLLDKSAPASTSISSDFSMPGISATAKTLVVRSSKLGDIEIVISSVGRVKICSDSLGRYPGC